MMYIVNGKILATLSVCILQGDEHTMTLHVGVHRPKRSYPSQGSKPSWHVRREVLHMDWH